jgi:hypothetical protein
MKHFIRQLIWKLISVPFQHAVDWNSDDQKAFESFCRSNTGAKFLELLRQAVATTTFRSVYHPSVSMECGRARGMQDLLATIHRLRRFPAVESIPASGEDVEPLPSQRAWFDSRKFSVGGSNSAIR